MAALIAAVVTHLKFVKSKPVCSLHLYPRGRCIVVGPLFVSLVVDKHLSTRTTCLPPGTDSLYLRTCTIVPGNTSFVSLLPNYGTKK